MKPSNLVNDIVRHSERTAPDTVYRWVQRGWVSVSTPFVIVSLLMLFGLAYDGGRIVREKVEQDRLARNIGVAILKAYNRAGCQYDWDNQNAKRVEFAIKAAAEAVDVAGVSAASVSGVRMPSEGPLTYVFDNDSGNSKGKVEIRFGSLSSTLPDAELGTLRPCTVVQPPPGNILGGVDNWEPSLPTQNSLIPSGFNWFNYLAFNPDLPKVGIDTEVEAKRQFSYSVKPESDQGRLGSSPVLVEPFKLYGVDVAVTGLSSASRLTTFARFFGFQRLSVSTSSVRVTHEVEPPQALQVNEIEISQNPPPFNAPAVKTQQPVDYTMSMDLKFANVRAPFWRNIFNSSRRFTWNNGTYGDLGEQQRRPALYIAGTDSPVPGVLHLVHGSGTDDNAWMNTAFTAKANEYFNFTWTVRGGSLRAFVNGVQDGSKWSPFNWAEQDWVWNAVLTVSSPNRDAPYGSVKVKNVYFWNRALSDQEVQSLVTKKPFSYAAEYKILDCKKWNVISRSQCSATCGGGTQVVTERLGCGGSEAPTRTRNVACNTRACASCQLDGREFSHGESGTFYTASSVACGESCNTKQEIRTCFDGTMDGSATLTSCTPVTCRNCTLDGVVVPHGTSREFFSASSVNCLSECSSVKADRSCSDGTLSGNTTFDKASCTKNACRKCSAGGVTVDHGTSRQFFAASSVGCGGTCSGESRTCSDGSLSGSYANSSCTVDTGSGENFKPCSWPNNNSGIRNGCWNGAVIGTFNQWNVGSGKNCVKKTNIKYKYFNSCGVFVKEGTQFTVNTSCDVSK